MIKSEHCPGVTAGRTIPVYGVPMHRQRKGDRSVPKWWRKLPQKYLMYNQNWRDEENGVETKAGKMRLGLCVNPSEVVGRISGASAINLALHLGAKRIAVIGLDCNKTLDVYNPEYTGVEEHDCHYTSWQMFLNETAANQVKKHWHANVVIGAPKSHCHTWPRMEPNDAVEWSLGGYITKENL
jgi:hypothetical protein